MSTFACWVPDHGETVDDARFIHAVTPREAAVEHATNEFHRGDPFDELEVLVRDEANEDTLWLVEVEMVPDFYAGLARQ